MFILKKISIWFYILPSGVSSVTYLETIYVRTEFQLSPNKLITKLAKAFFIIVSFSGLMFRYYTWMFRIVFSYFYIEVLPNKIPLFSISSKLSSQNIFLCFLLRHSSGSITSCSSHRFCFHPKPYSDYKNLCCGPITTFFTPVHLSHSFPWISSCTSQHPSSTAVPWWLWYSGFIFQFSIFFFSY